MLDREKLKANAITSIRLGIEDFQRSQLPASRGGDSERALSAARNLFAGALLLFKYRIATLARDPAEAAKLIYRPPARLVPGIDDAGVVFWSPRGRFREATIDLDEIRERFESFKILTDWDAVDRLRAERNQIEHLHPSASAAAIAGFVADLFPVLRDFVEREIGEPPAALLGPAWSAMLAHHSFFKATLEDCIGQWAREVVPAGMRKSLASARCDHCDSRLIKPSTADNVGHAIEASHIYACLGCGLRGSTTGAMSRALEEECGDWNPFDGEEPTVEACEMCGHHAFVRDEQACRWCGEELSFIACEICGEELGQDDQDNGGLCGFHANRLAKDD